MEWFELGECSLVRLNWCFQLQMQMGGKGVVRCEKKAENFFYVRKEWFVLTLIKKFKSCHDMAVRFSNYKLHFVT